MRQGGTPHYTLDQLLTASQTESDHRNNSPIARSRKEPGIREGLRYRNCGIGWIGPDRSQPPARFPVSLTLSAIEHRCVPAEHPIPSPRFAAALVRQGLRK